MKLNKTKLKKQTLYSIGGEIKKEDDMAHCDWTADSDKGETGNYKFEVSIKKIRS